jgi:hypothetical protein
LTAWPAAFLQAAAEAGLAEVMAMVTAASRMVRSIGILPVFCNRMEIKFADAGVKTYRVRTLPGEAMTL